jgi:DNA-binding MarR family transcriptional regulator
LGSINPPPQKGAASTRPRRGIDGTRAPRNDMPSPDVDPLALEVLGKFREIFQSAKKHFGAVNRSVGVSGAQLWALWELHAQPGLRVSDLASRLSIHQSTTSNLVEKLVSAKLVRRERRDADQRVVRLYLTATGERVLGRAPAPARGVLPDALSRLDHRKLKQLSAQLDGVLSAMEVRSPRAARIHLEQI